MSGEIRWPRSAWSGTALTTADVRYWKAQPALHQPDWPQDRSLARIRADLASLPELVCPAEIVDLRARLADVATGRVLVIQAGDCAENPAECTAAHIGRKVELLHELADALTAISGKPALRIGRIAGQFAKPTSRPVEQVGEVELPSYRGHLVNGIEQDPDRRRADPRRLIQGYAASVAALEAIYKRNVASSRPTVWTSHEALVLDYELPQLRVLCDGRVFLTSTHFPWIGERTRQPDYAHVRLMSIVANPVACKIGPTATVAELLALCRILDPQRAPGRLTLIVRMGADVVGERLPALVTAVRGAGHPVIWLCDPMHGNTLTGPEGRKTRFVPAIRHEIERFQEAVAAGGGTIAGLHLETTPDEVTECVRTRAQLPRLGERYTSLCDPRLNPGQALEAVSSWQRRH